MKVYSQGDQAIVVSNEKEVSQNLVEDLLALRNALLKKNLSFIIDIIPTESDMMITYDARDMMKHHGIQSPFLYMKALVESLDTVVSEGETVRMPVEIPVIYGGQYGPDLERVLTETKMTLEAFIETHTAPTYFMTMVGYSPGFPYLTGLNKRLFVNYTGDKKRFIPAGSVILEGKKSGITTNASYGDWLVIGYTPTRLFVPEEANLTVLDIGDRVKFKAVSEQDVDLGGFEACR